MTDLLPAQKVLLKIASGDACEADLSGLTGHEMLDLAEQAVAFRLAPLVMSRLEEAAGSLPRDARKLLDDETRMLARRWLIQQRVLSELSERFARKDISFVALKGVALALGHYADPLMRPMRDLDLLVSPHDAERTFQLLLAAGFEKLPGVISRPVAKSHQYPALRSPEGVLVEIHFRLMSDWPQGKALAERMLGASKSVRCLGAEIRVPEREDLALHLVAHATLNRPFDVGPQVFADLHAMGFGPEALTDALRAQAETFGLRRAVRLVSELSSTVRTGTSDSDQISAALILMFAREDAERERKFLLRLGGAQPDMGRVFASMVQPTPAALSELSGRAETDPRRWMAYPRWLSSRAARYRKTRGSPELLAEVALARNLSQWLRG